MHNAQYLLVGSFNADFFEEIKYETNFHKLRLQWSESRMYNKYGEYKKEFRCIRSNAQASESTSLKLKSSVYRNRQILI